MLPGCVLLVFTLHLMERGLETSVVSKKVDKPCRSPRTSHSSKACRCCGRRACASSGVAAGKKDFLHRSHTNIAGKCCSQIISRQILSRIYQRKIHLGERLLAQFAHVRLLAGVHPEMQFQSRGVRERSRADLGGKFFHGCPRSSPTYLYI